MSDIGPGNTPTYRIGAVSRLTGVPADTLRVWERRYSVVTPFRADSGTRLYGPEDVGRLTLIKRLVDRGDAISSVANLSLTQLRERVSGADLVEPERELGRPCRIAVLGEALSSRLRGEGALEGLELVGLFDRPDLFLAGAAGLSPDLVLFDYPTVHGDQVREVANLLAHCGASRAILIYGFATRGTLRRLEARRILTRRAPLDPAELQHWCLTLHRPLRGPASTGAGCAGEGAEVDIASPLPPRRFAETDLAQIAAAPSSVHCECPRHLVDLVTALAAFEAYSDECENRHADDAALHAFLLASAAQARSLMESALARLVEAEGIALGDRAGAPRGD